MRVRVKVSLSLALKKGRSKLRSSNQGANEYRKFSGRIARAARLRPPSHSSGSPFLGPVSGRRIDSLPGKKKSPKPSSPQEEISMC